MHGTQPLPRERNAYILLTEDNPQVNNSLLKPVKRRIQLLKHIMESLLERLTKLLMGPYL